jgi:hypothetical protein
MSRLVEGGDVLGHIFACMHGHTVFTPRQALVDAPCTLCSFGGRGKTVVPVPASHHEPRACEDRARWLAAFGAVSRRQS